MNILHVPAVLSVDNSVVDLETVEALYENVSVKNVEAEGFKIMSVTEKISEFYLSHVSLTVLVAYHQCKYLCYCAAVLMGFILICASFIEGHQ